MASADYRLCDVCYGKAFYDSDLNYTFESGQASPRRAGKDTESPTLDDLGDWAVLCTDCAKTHRTRIERIEETKP